MALVRTRNKIELFTLLGEPNGPDNFAVTYTGSAAALEITAPASLQFDADALLSLSELKLQIQTGGVDVFLPLESAEAPLDISVEILPQASANLFILGQRTRRKVKIALTLGRNAGAELFSLFNDAQANVLFAAELLEAAHANFTGLTRTQGNTATSIEVNVRHIGARGHTHQKFYSYARDTSQVSFTGRIAVEPGASGTEAHQLHRGVTLSHGARIDAQPFLNIMHDDVRCTHGSTVGFIDEEALGYLMARGLERPVAERLLIHSSERQFFDLLPAGKARDFFGFREEDL